jgi:hypothetical protein
MIIAVIQFFDTFFKVRFRKSLQKDLIFDDYLFISAKLLSSKHSFEVCKQIVSQVIFRNHGDLSIDQKFLSIAQKNKRNRVLKCNWES